MPTLPLFVHERLSTEAIVKTLEDHRKRPAQDDMFNLFADPQLPLSAQVNAYAHRAGWVNRMILGDSLSVMNSLARFEGLAGQVQCIYMDPPYGVKFGSNFQPFVGKRDVKHNDDADMTREPEMVQAYRDTWSLDNRYWAGTELLTKPWAQRITFLVCTSRTVDRPRRPCLTAGCGDVLRNKRGYDRSEPTGLRR